MKAGRDMLAEARAVVPLHDSRLDLVAQKVDADPMLSEFLAACSAEAMLGEREICFLQKQLGALHMGFFVFCILKEIPNAITFYEERGISRQILEQTLLDIPRNMEEYERLTGYFGIGGERYAWLYKHVGGRLFQLGRLQFEQRELQEHTRFGSIQLCAGTKVLDTHIPAGEPMPLEACHDSYETALSFFQRVFSFKSEGFVCESWLLSPELKRLLGKESNILKFAQEYQCEDRLEKDTSFMQYVFSTECTTISALPEDSSLQRKLKQFLLFGGTFHGGYGFRPASGQGG